MTAMNNYLFVCKNITTYAFFTLESSINDIITHLAPPPQKKIYRFPMLLKKYSDFGEGKKNLIESFCHITYC